MKIENLYGVANQLLISHGTKIAFQSYASCIAVYDMYTGEMKVGPDWNYSSTTSRHFKLFVNNKTRFLYETSEKFRKEMERNPKITFVEDLDLQEELQRLDT